MNYFGLNYSQFNTIILAKKIILLLNMKKGAFSTKNIIATNYQCLKPSKASNIDHKVQQITKQLMFQRPQRPQRQSLSKYHSNPQPNKTEQQLRKHIKTLQQQLKKKISEHGVLCKLLKTKTHGELGHLDIYLEISQLQEKNQEKDKKITQLIAEKQQLLKEVEILKQLKDQQENEHTEVVNTYSKDLDKIRQKFQQKEQQFQRQIAQYQNDKLLIKQLQKKISQLNYQLQCEKDAKEIQCFQLENKYESDIKQLNGHIEKIQGQVQQLQSKINQQKINYQQLKLQFEHSKKQHEMAIKASKIQMQELLSEQQQQMKRTRQQYEAQLQKIQSKYVQDNEKIVQQLKTEKQQMFKQLQQKNSTIQTLTNKYKNTQQQMKNLQSQYIQIMNEHNKLEQQHGTKNEQLKLANESLSQKNSKLIFKIEQLEAQNKQITNMILQKDKQLEEHIDSQFLKEQQIEKLKTKAKQLTQQLSKEKNNNKISVELYEKNYRAIGRLIELNNKIMRYLPQTINIEENANLDELIHILGKLLNQFIDKCFLPLTRKMQNTKYMNKEFIIEVQTLIGGFTSLISDDQLIGFVNQYLSMLKQSRHHDQENDQLIKQKRMGIVNSVQQKIFSLKTLKSLQSKNSLQLYDSLENTNKNYDSIRRYIEPRQPKRSVTKYLLEQASEQIIQRLQIQPRRQSSLKKLKTAFHAQDKQNNILLSNKNGKTINKNERELIMQRYFQNQKK